jgi:hypothetical protein
MAKRNSAARWVVDEASLRQDSWRNSRDSETDGTLVFTIFTRAIFQEISEGNNEEI